MLRRISLLVQRHPSRLSGARMDGHEHAAMLAFSPTAVNAARRPYAAGMSNDGAELWDRQQSAPSPTDSASASPTQPASDAGLGGATPVLTLSAGHARAKIVGGDILSVRSLRHRDEELLVEPETLAPPYRVHAKRAGITLLHPWANRLGADSYAFHGRLGQVDDACGRVTRDAHGLAIHGLMAPTPWRLAADGPAAAVASLVWLAEEGFPFAHQVVVRLTLRSGPADEITLHIATTVTALDSGDVPVAFGWHPYFHCERPATLELGSLTELGADPRGLPDGVRRPQGPSTVALEPGGDSLDDGVADLTPGSPMRLQTGDRTISVTFDDGYSHGQIFAPADAPVVSLEPMTAPTDALRSGVDLPSATPERPYSASFSIRVS